MPPLKYIRTVGLEYPSPPENAHLARTWHFGFELSGLPPSPLVVFQNSPVIKVIKVLLAQLFIRAVLRASER